MYNQEQVELATLEYFNGNELATNVWISKYALRDLKGNLLEFTPDDMHIRIANEFARIEKNKFKNPLSKEEIYQYLKNYEQIIPQGSPMYGIGNNYRNVSLSNCYTVQSPYDSYGGICHTDEEIAQISKRRGGIGYDISTLRPSNMTVSNSAGTTTGAVSFMHRFSHTGNEVGQMGRRGAQMITMSVHHPDIEDFINIKNDEQNVTGANISVRLTNEFLIAVEKNEEYELRWPVDDTNSPEISKTVNAREIWNKIIHSAWFRAEPGLLFWDNIIKESPADCYADEGYKTVSTNPCSELPLSAYDSCRLLAINLFSCVKNPFHPEASFDYDKLYNLSIIAQRLMDDLVDLEIEKIKNIINKIKKDPEPKRIKKTELELWKKILESTENGRRTGTGITALGDVIAALNISYGSEESIKIVDEIYKTLKLGCYRSSVDISKELGSFVHYNKEKEKDCPFIQRIAEEDLKLYADMCRYGRRNIACLTTAPTGSLSTQAKIGPYFGTTSGIEPCYMMSYTRRKRINPGDKDLKTTFTDNLGESWAEFDVHHNGVQYFMDQTNKKPKQSFYYKSCAPDIDWISRVRLQSAAQKHIDHAISSTINLPNNVTEKEVAKIYNEAWKVGLKGITVYRDGCRSGILVSKKEEKAVFPEERPKELPCDVHHITIKGQQYFILVGLLDEKPYEVFAGKNGFLSKNIKSGIIIRKRKDFYKAIFDNSDEELSPITASTDEMEEVVTRLTSGLLRVGADMQFIVQQLEKVGERQTEMYSFARSVSRALKKYIPDGTNENGKCPECDTESLIRQEGCVLCQSCGYTKCL